MNSLNLLSTLSSRTQFAGKAHNARLALQDASRLWLYLPAYVSLLIALGAACRALAHFITNSDVTIYLWLTLIVNSAISMGILCGGPALKRWVERARVLLFVFLPISAFIFNASILAPLEAEAEINATVSLLVGWAALLCVLLIGMRYGQNASGEQRVALSAPLVPALSLFGLLNSLSVDTIVQICFVIFVAAALYLIAYERMLNRFLKGDRSFSFDPKSPDAAPEYSGLRSGPILGGHNPFIGFSRAAIARTAIGYFIACCLWLVAFIGGAALFYYPIAAILPRVLGVPLNAVRSASASLLDWRGSSSTMELRGGNYPLSDREVMTVETGTSAIMPSLWRGRIYENYDSSRWVEDPKQEAIVIRLKRGLMTPLAPIFEQTQFDNKTLSAFHKPLPPISQNLVRTRTFEALIEPQRSNNTTLYFPGELAAVQGVVQLQAFPLGTFNALSSYRSTPYAFRTNVKEERLSRLKLAPGLSPAQLRQWRRDKATRASLGIDADLKEKLAPIIAQIKKDALSVERGGFDTPLEKANAIRNYLATTCTYSLSSPLVPSNQDAIVFFLTSSKTGACDMFASAMTMLLRAVDVPARLATGYIEPEEIEEKPGASEAKAQTINYIVRERDAHAWVEYFIPGAGWLNYDPTQGTRTTDLPIDAQIAGILNLPSLHLDFKTLWIPALGFLLIAAGLGWSFFDFQARKIKAKPTTEDLERARVIEIYAQALALLSRRVPRSRHQTPLEYEAAVQRAKIADPAKQEFSALTYLLMAARYRQEPPAMSQPELQACLARLRQALKRA